MTVSIRNIPFDVLLVLFTHLEGDSRALFASCLTSRVFFEAAQENLYRHVRLDYLAKTVTHSALKTLERQSRLRQYVLSIDIVLHAYPIYTTYVPSTGILSSLPKLSSVTLRFRTKRGHVPFFFPTILWKDLAPQLKQCSALHTLHILFRISQEDIPEIKDMPFLRHVTIGSPTNGFFDEHAEELCTWTTLAIPDSASLDATNFPAAPVLRNLVIGSGHCLNRHDLLILLTYTPQLRALDVFYDNFASYDLVPNITPPSLCLEHLIVRYQGVTHRSAYYDLFKWIRIVVPKSTLHTLVILSDDTKGCSPMFTAPLVDFVLSQKNLRVLSTPTIGFREHDFTTMVESSHIRILAQARNDILYRVSPKNLDALYLYSWSVTDKVKLAAEGGYIRHLRENMPYIHRTIWSCDKREHIDPLEVELTY